MSVALAIDAFTADLEARSIRRPTRNKYRQLLAKLNAFSEENGIVILRQWNVQAARDFRATWSTWSSITSNKMLERTRAFFRFCVESGWIEKNPASMLKRAKETHPPTMPFTPAEVVSILRALDDRRAGREGDDRIRAERLRALMLVMLWSGLRISDAVMLRGSQVQGDTILLPQQTKTGVSVRIPVPPEVIEALDQCPLRGEYYFACNDNHETQSTSWRRKINEVFAAAKVDNAHTHRFRDTFAVRLLEAGVSMENVSRLLGHGSVLITEQYYAPWVRSRQEQLESSVRKAWRGTKEVQTSPSENQLAVESMTSVLVPGVGLAPGDTTNVSQVVGSTKKH